MTILQQASQNVPGFAPFYQKFLQRMTIYDRAKSTTASYGRSLASLALHFNRVPTELTPEQIEEYLYTIKQRYTGGSDNCFKFSIYSLRFVFRQEGMDELRIKLPPIKRSKKLPVVLSKEEITTMMNSPRCLRHRVIIALLYGCGLRCGELRNIKITDIDLNRAVLHIRQGKGKKDRYLPLGNTLLVLLKKYLEIEHPRNWLFTGKYRNTEYNRTFTLTESKYGQRSVQWIIKRAALLAGIRKPVNVHSLRHTYATHLLEDGVSIVTLKELLGHASIFSTLIYLRVAQVANSEKCSPLDSLKDLRILPATQMRFSF